MRSGPRWCEPVPAAVDDFGLNCCRTVIALSSINRHRVARSWHNRYVSAIHVLREREWARLRDTRLTALKDSSEAFLSTYERELAYSDCGWRAEFARGEWTIELSRDEVIGLLGATREPAEPPNERYLKYMWVSPLHRRCGVATRLVENVLERLAVAGINTILLWTLDGNEPARQFYNKWGFVSTQKRQKLPEGLERYEELLRRELNLNQLNAIGNRRS